MQDFSIGALSRETGVKVPTIRYYETIGLLPEPPRTEGGQRRYDRHHRERLAFISHARAMGFPIEAIRSLLDLAAHPEKPCDKADEIAFARLQEVEQRIARLERLRAELKKMVASACHGTAADCRIIEVLSDHGQCGTEH